jgi:anti-sigma factor RsiW
MTDHVFEYIPAYAIGALDPDELEQIDHHLATCDVCRLEL